MKLKFANGRSHALTLTEVLVIVVLIAVLIAILLPFVAASKRRYSRVGCSSDLKQIVFAFRIWEGDNGDKYPTAISVTNGGVMESAATGNAAAVFQVMSNELNATKILICPYDTNHLAATNWTTDFGNNHISYFVGLEAADKYPNSILAGDDNFEIGGMAVKPGVLDLPTNTPIAWTGERHQFKGNIGLADGSVEGVNNTGLAGAIINPYKSSPDFTNRIRLAIP